MNTKKATKRALLTSVMALVMCVVMLVGTTFAWFTDTASTGVNKIQAGNLKVQLLKNDGTVLGKDDYLNWVKAEGHEEEEVLWEPNCTYDLEEFQIKNAGNLALKYMVVLKASNVTTKGDKSLLDVIEWTVKVNDEVVKAKVPFADLNSEKGTIIIDGEELIAGENANIDKITVTGHMKEEAGNDYQGLKIEGFGITVYAAQVNHESDSFGTSYDTAAPYDSSAPKTPLVVSVGTKDELQTALTTLTSAGAGDNVINLTQDFAIGEGETWTPATVDGYHGAGVITINGNGHTITGLNAPLLAGGFAGNSGVVINNLTLDGVKIIETANTASGPAVGAFIGNVDSMQKIELNNCKLVNSHVEGGHWTGGLIGYVAGYNGAGEVKTYVTIKDCTIENSTIKAYGSGGAIIGHAGGNANTFQTVQDCTVKDCIITSTNTSSWRVGVVAGTVGVGRLTISGTTSTKNTITQTNKTAPTEQSDLYGRFVPGTTGKLTIDGTEVNG